jgi:hypothetical protein
LVDQSRGNEPLSAAVVRPLAATVVLPAGVVIAAVVLVVGGVMGVRAARAAPS